MTDETTAHRTAAAEALENGDSQVADEAYALELASLEDNVQDVEQDEQGVQADSEYVENAFSYLSDEFGEETVDTLRAHWVDEESAREGLALGQALAEDHPEVISIAEEFGLADHPGLLKLAEYFARKSGYTYDTTGTQKKETSMETNTNQESYAKGMRDFDARIKLAQEEGNSALANEIYQKQMVWIASAKGDDTIVGGRTRSTIRNA